MAGETEVLVPFFTHDLTWDRSRSSSLEIRSNICTQYYLRILVYLSKLGLRHLHPTCVSAYPPPPSNFECLNKSLWYVYHGRRAHVSGVLHKSQPTVCVSVCVSLLSLEGNSSVNVPAATNTRSKRIIVELVILYAVHVLWQENLCNSSSERMLQKDYDRNGSVEKKKLRS